MQDDPSAAPGWLVTYGDMMTLLLTFFVMLVSMSELKSEQRVTQAVESIQRRFGTERPSGAATERGRGPKLNMATSGDTASESAPPGKTVMIGGRVYFAEDSAELTDEELAKLAAICEQFQGKAQKIEVRGHTSRKPPSPDASYDDHWQLAYMRARVVADRMIASGIDSRRIRLGVAGGNEPTSTGDDPIRRRENSRVELFLLNEFNADFENSVPAAAAAESEK